MPHFAKIIHVITFDMNIVKHSWFGPCTWRNRVIFERLPVDFKKISLGFTCAPGKIERDGVSNHRLLDCFLNRLFRRRSKKISKLLVTGLCEGNPPVTGGLPSQRASNAETFKFDDVIMFTCQSYSEWAPWIKSSYGQAKRDGNLSCCLQTVLHCLKVIMKCLLLNT